MALNLIRYSCALNYIVGNFSLDFLFVDSSEMMSCINKSLTVHFPHEGFYFAKLLYVANDQLSMKLLLD